MSSSRAKFIRLAISSAGIAMFLTFASRAVPELPGATNTCVTPGDCASFHASACSRPPEPTTRIFLELLSIWAMLPPLRAHSLAKCAGARPGLRSLVEAFERSDAGIGVEFLGLYPVHDLDAAVEVLGQRGAALHPVAAVVVCHAVHLAYVGLMGVAADHAVHP